MEFQVPQKEEGRTYTTTQKDYFKSEVNSVKVETNKEFIKHREITIRDKIVRSNMKIKKSVPKEIEKLV